MRVFVVIAELPRVVKRRVMPFLRAAAAPFVPIGRLKRPAVAVAPEPVNKRRLMPFLARVSPAMFIPGLIRLKRPPVPVPPEPRFKRLTPFIPPAAPGAFIPGLIRLKRPPVPVPPEPKFHRLTPYRPPVVPGPFIPGLIRLKRPPVPVPPVPRFKRPILAVFPAPVPQGKPKGGVVGEIQGWNPSIFGLEVLVLSELRKRENS